MEPALIFLKISARIALRETFRMITLSTRLFSHWSIPLKRRLKKKFREASRKLKPACALFRLELLDFLSKYLNSIRVNPFLQEKLPTGRSVYLFINSKCSRIFVKNRHILQSKIKEYLKKIKTSICAI